MGSIIKFKSVSKSFGNLNVLKDLYFNVSEFEYIALIGNNGCGKTTTINAMCNLISYDTGQVFMFGKEVDKKYVSYKNRMGIVLSDPYYIEEFTPNQYLKFVCEFQHVPKKEVQKRIQGIIDFLEIENYKKKRIKEYSSGNQMKLSLGSALIHNPELLVLDEPFTNLDISTVASITELLKSFKGRKTLFVSSHDLDLVANLCNRFLIMDKGKIAIDINKNDFESTEEMKLHIKDKLIQKNVSSNKLEWLK